MATWVLVLLTPDAKLAIDATSQGNFTEAMRISNTGGGANEGNYIQFETSNTSGYGPRIGGRREGTGGSGLHFYTGEINAVPTEKVRIDHDGNVGIGTTSPNSSFKLTVNGQYGLRVQNADSNNSAVNFGVDTSSGYAFIDSTKTGTGSFLPLRFGTSDLERMRIDSSGNLLVGRTSTISFGSNTADGAVISPSRIDVSAASVARITQVRNSTGTFDRYYNAGNIVGSITCTTSATAYNTTSDGRLKDVTGSARGLEVINELNPVSYNWKADGKADEGLIAQEVLDIVPNAVSGSEEDMYQMDYSKLVVHLVAGMKEQQTLIESLMARITTLEG